MENSYNNYFKHKIYVLSLKEKKNRIVINIKEKKWKKAKERNLSALIDGAY